MENHHFHAVFWTIMDDFLDHNYDDANSGGWSAPSDAANHLLAPVTYILQLKL